MIGNRLSNRVVRAPRGPVRTCKSWLSEAAYRMAQNNLDPEVAEHPQALVVYGGIGRAARNWECFDRILEVLQRLEDDETLLVQSGKPVGVFKTHADAPRVLLANSNLVPHWATWEHFHALDRQGLMMYGQMTAGSWIYIGSQGIVQGTYETFVAMADQHFGGRRAGALDPDRRPGRHGRRPAPGRDHGRLLDAGGRVRRDPDRFPPGDPLLRPQGDLARRGAGHARGIQEGQPAALDRPARQRRRDLPRPARARHPARLRHRPDLRPRPAQRLPAGRLDHGGVAGAARERPRRRHRGRQALDGGPGRGHAGVPETRRRPWSTTATTSARWPRRWASHTPSTSRASSRPTSGRCSARASARSAGARCRAIPRTSTGPTPR